MNARIAKGLPTWVELFHAIAGAVAVYIAFAASTFTFG